MTQLFYEQCIQLQALIESKLTQKEISVFFGVNQSSISRELGRCPKGQYNYESAWKNRQDKRKEINIMLHTKITLESSLARYIIEKLLLYWSPEQIAGSWNLQSAETICYQTIYSFIYNHYPEYISKYLRRHGKKYKKSKSFKGKIPNRISINLRDKIIEDRVRKGDFEGDTIVGKNTGDRIVTLVCRMSRYLLGGLILQERNSSLAIATSTEIFCRLRDSPHLNTITFDNGTEFCDREYITENLKVLIYFADPYSSWQRGTNENTNGLLRQFFPKCTDFSTLTDETLQYYISLINSRPRKCLGFKTPEEVYNSI